jgi:hypothetical protein
VIVLLALVLLMMGVVVGWNTFGQVTRAIGIGMLFVHCLYSSFYMGAAVWGVALILSLLIATKKVEV